MIKKFLMATLAIVALGAAVRPVSAQTFFGDVSTIDDSKGGIQGIFEVSTTKDASIANRWNVFVDFESATVVNPHPDVFRIGITLLDNPGLDTTSGFDVVSGSGGVPGQAYKSVFGPTFEFVLQPGGVRTLGKPVTSRVQSGVSFSGFVIIDPTSGTLPTSTVKGAHFRLEGSIGSGTGTFPPNDGVTPEGASLLLFLPGLIPVAVGLRRRRLNKPAGE
jgi:hypothetical protein